MIKRNKQFRVHIEYGFINLEFTIKHRTIMAGITATLFIAVAHTIRALLGNF